MLSGPSASADHLYYVEPTELELEMAAAAQPEPDPEAAPGEYSGSPIPDYLVGAMAALRICESSGDYGANTGNGYYGAYQFSLSTWNWLGYGGYPHEASPWVQDEAAVALYNLTGWSPGPPARSTSG
jgi:hypothetical protein